MEDIYIVGAACKPIGLLAGPKDGYHMDITAAAAVMLATASDVE